MTTNEKAAAQLVELPQLETRRPSGPAVIHGLQALQGAKISLTVVVGRIQTTLGVLMALKEGTVLELDREVDSPVDVLIEGIVAARGQLVVVGDNFGVRVTETGARQ